MRVAELRDRIEHDESGLTLLELLITLLIIGILLAIAVPSYLALDGRASSTAAQANLHSALPAVEAYHEDHATYDPGSMTLAALRVYDQSLAAGISVVSGSVDTYCLKSTQGNTTAYKNGPGAAVSTTPCT